ncbi:putative membrane zinc transporter protein [Diplocarpon rosae]|nr:putative membrane zinc transporter protein [Diplocarpon rosae]
MASPKSVVVDCESGNNYDGRLALRISSIFVIGFGSCLGALLPIALARTKRMHVSPVAFFIAKYFGSGVIIATAFIHLLTPATEALQSPCLSGPIANYSWAEGIALMTIFSMFFLELMVSRFDMLGTHEHEGTQLRDTERCADSESILKQSPASKELHQHGNNGHTQDADLAANNVSNSSSVAREPPTRIVTNGGLPGRDDDFSYPPGGEDHLGHSRSHSDEHGHFAAQMTGIFILEFGVIFHSIFIGLTLAVTGSEFVVLYIVLSFHQTFEGLGLGSRLATATWPKSKSWLPWVLGGAFGITTPIAIAIGLGIRNGFAPGSPRTLIIQGIFDSISAGILIYTGLVELMAHEFMFSAEMRKTSIGNLLLAFACMCIGAGLMAVLGRWA